ncbi:3-dehydroquinate synthase [Nitrospiraceae bacterium HYJII51-Mn-bac16s-1-B09]|uniref:3-dehydroquinate synthase n=1 Tax=Candidatus Manganitrophus noduliformans TaxID=2606439 RepID=A0A7X6IAS4_9BACT|nr:3-dehydroquinate synthase [Candidatus Manganitrophus noduliformans]
MLFNRLRERSWRLKVEKVRLSLGANSYDVVIGTGVRNRLGPYLRALSLGEKVAVVTNPAIDRLYGAGIRRSLQAARFVPKTIRIRDGERYKNLTEIERIYDQLILHRFERGSTLVALGGGVIGDMAGFAAATFLRGIPFVQVPTTVVAQVDASIGGKTGVDHPRGKNLIGAFHQPKLVCVDPGVLGTLPRREFIAGLAEVVKYGVIMDAAFFKYLEENAAAILAMDSKKLFHCIKRSAALKAKVVSADERESGLRKILNYGHTLGHAVETLTGYRKYKHGEAVAIGMASAAKLSYRLGLTDWQTVQRQISLLRTFHLPTELPKLDPGSILETMERDKKVAGGEIFFVLPEKIGVIGIVPVDRKVLKAFLSA